MILIGIIIGFVLVASGVGFLFLQKVGAIHILQDKKDEE
jgi:hypothetical protein